MPSKTNQSVIVDDKIDTNQTFYLESLKCNKDILEGAFGKPVEGEGRCKNEWKIMVNGHVYSIYDWEGYEGWHLGGQRKVKKDIELIKERLYAAVGEEYNKDFDKWAKRYLRVCWDEGSSCMNKVLSCPVKGVTPIQVLKNNKDVFFCADEEDEGTWWQEYQEDTLRPLEAMEAYFSYRASV